MNTQEAIQILKSQFQSKDWFSDVESGQFNNIIVYVKYFSAEVVKTIPDKVEGYPILTHFAVSKMDGKQFITNASTWQPPQTKGEWMVETVKKLELDHLDEPTVSKPIKSKSRLLDELDRLANICGDNILQEVFYETHDGKNALTNFSAKYPAVKKAMEQLYAEYGFDAINEEWE